MNRKALLLVLAMLAASAAWAQQYRWVDEKGRVHYTDTPPPPSAKSAQKKNLKGNELGQQPSYELTQAIRNAPVTLYTFADCKDLCQMARDVLNRRGVPFKEKLISNQQMLDELKQVSGGLVQLAQGWHSVNKATSDKPWTIDAIEGVRDQLFKGVDSGVPAFTL